MLGRSPLGPPAGAAHQDRAPRAEQGRCGPPGWNQRHQRATAGQACSQGEMASPKSSSRPQGDDHSAIPAHQRGGPPPPQALPSERPLAAGLGLKTERSAGLGDQGPPPAHPPPQPSGRAGVLIQAPQAVRVRQVDAALANAWALQQAVARPHASQPPRTFIPFHIEEQRRQLLQRRRHGFRRHGFRRSTDCGWPTDCGRPGCPARMETGATGHSSGSGHPG